MSVRWSDQDNAWVTGPLTPADAELDRGARVGSRPWVHLLLFVLTFLTMTWAGSSFFLNYITAVGTRRVIIAALLLEWNLYLVACAYLLFGFELIGIIQLSPVQHLPSHFCQTVGKYNGLGRLLKRNNNRKTSK